MSTEPTLYGGPADRRVTVRDIATAKARGERWAMLTAYDALTARVFDEAGIPAPAALGVAVTRASASARRGRRLPRRDR